MDALNFAYWLNGFAELHGGTPPSEAQWKAIREHLALVFNKVTPAMMNSPTIAIPTSWPNVATPGQRPYQVTC